jgi:hypothetical protein
LASSLHSAARQCTLAKVLLRRLIIPLSAALHHSVRSAFNFSPRETPANENVFGRTRTTSRMNTRGRQSRELPDLRRSLRSTRMPPRPGALLFASSVISRPSLGSVILACRPASTVSCPNLPRLAQFISSPPEPILNPGKAVFPRTEAIVTSRTMVRVYEKTMFFLFGLYGSSSSMISGTR